jgi:hypothetical protein
MLSTRIAMLLALLLSGCGNGREDPGHHDTDTTPLCTNCDAMCDANGCVASCPADEDCAVQCSAEPVCEVGCPSGNNCNVTCEGPTECPIDCTGTNNCEPVCRDGASCFVDCNGANNCDQLECTDGASCTVDCAGANNCSFAACDHPEGTVDCGGGILVCNAPCP